MLQEQTTDLNLALEFAKSERNTLAIEIVGKSQAHIELIIQELEDILKNHSSAISDYVKESLKFRLERTKTALSEINNIWEKRQNISFKDYLVNQETISN